MQKNITPLKYALLLMMLSFIAVTAGAQTQYPITGSITAEAGSTKSYTYWSDEYYFMTSPSWSIVSASGGIVQTSSVASDHYTANSTIQWKGPGTYTLRISYGGNVIGSLSVIVSCGSPPGNPTFDVKSPICTTGSSGSAYIEATPGSNGTDVKWYNSGGTLLSTGLTYTTPTVSTTTIYTIKSVSANGYCQSSGASVSISVNPVVNVPTAVVDGSRCGSGAVTLSATPASPATSIRWYSSVTAGEVLSTGTTFSVTRDKRGVFYAASYNPTTGCSSATRASVIANIMILPSGLIFYTPTIYGSGIVTLEAQPQSSGGKRVHYLPDTTDLQVRWYASNATATSNTGLLGKGVTYTSASAVFKDTVFYTRIHDKTSNCMGPVTPAYAKVKPLLSRQSIVTTVMRVGGVKAESTIAALPDAQRSVSVTHFDGFGRVSQQIAVKASPDGKDIIQPIEYDVLGRTSKQYLPYVDSTTSGRFHSPYSAEQYNFYQRTDTKVATDPQPYAKSVYENSPLGRLIEQTRVGQSFQLDSGHTGTIVYGVNTASGEDAVRKFNTDGTSSGFYAANVLRKTESINAQGIHSVTFTDPAGRTIVTRQQLDKTVESTAITYLETYNIYNEMGQLRYTIQPKGVIALKANGWTLTAPIKKQYVFQYVYDERGRVTETRVPGKGWSYVVYNQLNQPVLTQDTALFRKRQWLYMKYDLAGRVVMTGLYTNTSDTTRTYFETLLKNKNYTTERYFESRNAAGTHQYTNVSFPTSGTEVLSVTYYDNYDFDTYGTYTSQSIEGLTGEGVQGRAFGKVTGSKTLIPGTSDWLKKYLYYDRDGRVIQVRSNNHLNLTPDNLTTTTYDFEKALQTLNIHKAGTAGTTKVLNTYAYYDQGRLKQVKQKNNGGTDQLVVKYEYNALGQVVDKKLHGTGTPGSETFLQSVDYCYTINGELKSINNSELTSNALNDDTNDYFGMELLYQKKDSLPTTKRYDGMISAIKWKSVGAVAGVKDQRSYAFQYDKSGKLETAAYKVKSKTVWDRENGAQDETMTYDANGNIKSLARKQRKYQLVSASGSYTNETIDNLAYEYKTNDANSLLKVTDGAGASAAVGFDNGGSNSNNDYAYDMSGNLRSDANKGISGIMYNFQGKPTQVTFTDGRKIEYVYDAGGNKLTQKLFNGSILVTTTEYVNGFVYEKAGTGSTVLSFFGAPEGRVVKNGSNLDYEYSIADHQGNTRVVFSSAAPTITAPETNFENNSEGFLNFPAGGTLSTLEIFDHTDAGTVNKKSTVLNGGYNSQVGVAKTFKVYPGDKIKAEAFVKYEEIPETPVANNLTGFATVLAGAFGVNSSSTGEALKVYNSLNTYGGAVTTGTAHASDPDEAGVPKAFVTIMFFDKNYNYLDAAWQQVAAGYEQDASLINKDAFDHVIKEVIAKEEGYAYVFISNESPTFINVYFDDVKFTHTPSNVIQYNEYYPFGLQTSSSWTRETAKDNNYLYNAGNELNKTNGWYEMYYRGYDPAIGRMLQVDPYAPMYASLSTYNYALNNPAYFNDPYGGQAEGPYADFWNNLLDYTTAMSHVDGFYGWSANSEGEFHEFGSQSEANSWANSYSQMWGGAPGMGGDFLGGSVEAVRAVDWKNTKFDFSTQTRQYAFITTYKYVPGVSNSPEDDGVGNVDPASFNWFDMNSETRGAVVTNIPFGITGTGAGKSLGTVDVVMLTVMIQMPKTVADEDRPGKRKFVTKDEASAIAASGMYVAAVSTMMTRDPRSTVALKTFLERKFISSLQSQISINALGSPGVPGSRVISQQNISKQYMAHARSIIFK